jgi:hypothetical protein
MLYFIHQKKLAWKSGKNLKAFRRWIARLMAGERNILYLSAESPSLPLKTDGRHTDDRRATSEF